MADTMRAIRAAMKRQHVRRGGFPMPVKRYAPRPWYPVQPRGYYGTHPWKRIKRHG